MKKPYLFIAAILLFSIQNISAQGNSVKISNTAAFFIQQQADSLKTVYENKGFILLKASSMKMESQYEMPVIVPLNEGTFYEFIFIGEYTSKLYEVRMYDWDEKMVVYLKKQWGEIDGNIIDYSYIPKKSEMHMIKPIQVNKKKKILDGYVMLFKKVK